MRLVLLIFVIFASVTYSHAGGRYALVIGNSNYTAVSKLANPQNDANDISASLKRLGFEVTPANNLGFSGMRRALGEFSQKALGADMAIIFFAGHGMEVNKQNYLIPTDAKLETDLSISYEAIPLDLVTEAVSGAKGLKLVMLDACRNNPFSSQIKLTNPSRSIGRGFARVEPVSGTLVTFAAKEGTVASDGVGRNSPYTKALLAHLEEPGLEINFLFRKVRDSVMQDTSNRQQPFTYGSLPGARIYLKPEDSVDKPKITSPSNVQRPSREHIELALWTAVKDSNNEAVVQSYLDKFPAGMFSVVAKEVIRKLGEGKKQTASLNNNTSQQLDNNKIIIEDHTHSIGQKEIKLAQQKLSRWGAGKADGKIGAKTIAAIKAYQSDWQLPAIGEITADLLARLERIHPATKPQFYKTNLPNCRFYNSSPAAKETINWNGGCRNGKANGKGTVVYKFTENGKQVSSRYVGDVEDGLKSGRGIFYYRSGDRYEGDFNNNKLHGKGTYYWTDGQRYEGEWKNGKKHGQGKEFMSSGQYTGEYKNDDMSGQGTAYFKNGNRYEGDFKNNKLHGKGTYYWKNGDRYEGEYKNANRQGQGTFFYFNGDRYEGDFNNNKLHGKGTYYWKNGDHYVGDYKNGKMQGQGTFFSTNDKPQSGLWRNDKFIK